MPNNEGYSRLSTSLPSHPPGYEDLEASLEVNEHDIQIEDFEIEDIPEEPIQSDSIIYRASLMTKKIANSINKRFVNPVGRMIDPMYEAYQYFNGEYERVILKIGNPLIVKRLMYVIFVTATVFCITKLNSNYGVDTNGGAFTSGKLYNLDALAEYIPKFIDTKQMKENLEYLSSMPHISGTMGDLALGKYIEKTMTNNGINLVDFDDLKNYLNYPVYNEDNTYVKMADNSYKATLFEMNKKDMEYLAYNPNSLNTNEPLESSYVYANFGSPEDFKKLLENKFDLKDNILLIKYGGSIPESNKVQIAQSYGVKAILFITPRYEIMTDGKKILHEDIIQKINVGFTRISPGDVLTPDSSSEEEYTTRVPWFKSNLTPKIPSIPISWKDGQYFISQLEGMGVKFDEFYSGVPNGDKKIRMKLTSEERPTHQIWNVIGSIAGREQSQKGIIIGATRDSTCFGTLSSNTGTVVLLEMIKVFTSMQRKFNWSPSRSIYFVSFDATQYNLAGAAEWVENEIEQIKKNGYTYIDLSDAVSGDILQINSNPFLHEIIKNALRKVQDTGSKTLYDRYLSQHGNDEISNQMVQQKNYIPFINKVNLPSLEIKFTGTSYPENSCYDNFENFETANIDTHMEKHKQLVQLLSIIALDLAESPLIPYNFIDLSSKLSQYANDLDKYAKDIKSQFSHPEVKDLSFDSLKKSLEALKNTGAKYIEWAQGWKEYVKENSEPSLLALSRWKRNENAIQFNEIFLVKNVDPHRPGYVNVLFGAPFMAPDSSSADYEWNSFPVVRNFIYEGDFNGAQFHLDQLANLIIAASDRVNNMS